MPSSPRNLTHFVDFDHHSRQLEITKGSFRHLLVSVVLYVWRYMESLTKVSHVMLRMGAGAVRLWDVDWWSGLDEQN